MPLTKVRVPGWMVAFASTGARAYPASLRDGTWEPGAWGITVSSAEDVFTHPCPGVNGGHTFVPISGQAPRLFLNDLRSIAGVEFGELVDTTFDGRPAIAATVFPWAARCEVADYHVSLSNIEGGWVQLRLPSHLLVAEVNGMPIVFQVWGSTASDLEAAMPAAASFLAGVHFTGESNE